MGAYPPGHCVACGKETETVLDFQGPYDWLEEVLKALGVPASDAHMTLVGQPGLAPAPGADTYQPAALALCTTVCTECVFATGPWLPRPVEAVSVAAIPTVKAPHDWTEVVCSLCGTVTPSSAVLHHRLVSHPEAL